VRGKPLIGISKIVSHPALDAVEKGIIDEISNAGASVRFDFQNANGTVATAQAIAANVEWLKARGAK